MDCNKGRIGWRNIAISNNVGGVKGFSSALLHALKKERHFALVDLFCAFQPGLASNRWGQELSPVLKAERGGDENLEVHLACPSDDEKACVYAGQFVSLFGRAGWQVQPFVDRVHLTNASDGITAIRKAGNKEYMLKHWDSGGYVAINEAHLLAVQEAFQTIHIEIDSRADPDLAENVMMLYVGPERENESEPTQLTKSTEWVTGARKGPFPNRSSLGPEWFLLAVRSWKEI